MTKARDLADLGNKTSLDEINDAYDAGALSNRNRIINGSFKISQRGDFSSATTITNWQYYIDRFKCYGQSNGAKLTHADNSLKLEAFTTATNRMFAMTKLEPVDIQKNTTYTLSFYVTTNSSNFRVHVNDLSSPVLTYTSPSVVVPNGVRTKVSVPISVGSTVTTVFEIAIGLFASGRTNVAITSGDYFVLEEVQLEVGDTATPFEHRSYGDELAKCQRYFQIYKPNRENAVYTSFNPKFHMGQLTLQGQMRTDPTTTWYDGNMRFAQVGYNSVSATMANTQAHTFITTGMERQAIHFNITRAAGGSTPTGDGVYNSEGSTARFFIDAEL